jgi:transposase InsO family protein
VIITTGRPGGNPAGQDHGRRFRHSGGVAVTDPVIDIASRRVVGFAMADHLRTELISDALGKAVAARDRPRAWSSTTTVAAVHLGSPSRN